MKAKRSLRLLLLVFVFSAALLAFAACGPELPDNSAGVTVRLIVLDENSAALYDEELDTSESSLYGLLTGTDGLSIDETGGYLDKVSILDENGGVKLSISGAPDYSKWISVYHNIDDIMLKDVSGYAEDLIFDGNTHFLSGVGIKDLPLKDGASYLLKLFIS